jgi:hypothetical protein
LRKIARADLRKLDRIFRGGSLRAKVTLRDDKETVTETLIRLPRVTKSQINAALAKAKKAK